MVGRAGEPGCRARREIQVQCLVSEGININVTLLFGLGRYQEVAQAFIAGLETRAAKAQSVGVASVASFFLSRIDVLVDRRLDELERAGQIRSASAAHLRGQAAIASARLAYQIYRNIFEGDRFRVLAAKGAHPQRLLWASTSTKNPAYSDVKYVEPLIGEGTINTVPLKTLDAYRDHGNPALRLEENVEESRRVLAELRATSIDLDGVAQRLEDDGVRTFVSAYDRLHGVIGERREAALRKPRTADGAS